MTKARDVIRVCVAGVTGWTGRAVADAIEAADDLELVAGVSRSDPGSFSSVAEALDAVEADVLVDYTHAAVVKQNVVAAIERGVAVVVGSSGMSAADYDEIDAAARANNVGVVAAGNFSITAALLLRFSVEAARHLEMWEVIDYASASKQDAPSGTSREVAERLDASARRNPRSARRGARRARGARRHDRRYPGPLGEAAELHGLDRDSVRRRGRAAVDSPRRGESAAPYVAGTLLAVRAVGRTDRAHPRARSAARLSAMRRILVTGMSGTGKSTALAELGAAGLPGRRHRRPAVERVVGGGRWLRMA